MSRHEQLWAPWRLAYVTGDVSTPPRPATADAAAGAECFLCRGVAENNDHANLIVERTAHSLVVLNRYPYNNGHLLVAPLGHIARPNALSDAEQLDLQRLIARYTVLLERLLAAQGFNVGLNLGRIAGAGLPGHLHWHVVPRWAGDTNFMPVAAGVRVIPQSLDALWELLRESAQPAGPRT